MKRRDYTNLVLKGLRHVTESEKEEIRAELDAHMEDHMLELIELGWEADEAEEKAAGCMGDPAEVSRELQKCYAYGWLAAWRVLFLILTILCIVAGIELLRVGYGAAQNLQSRFAPMSHLGESNREQVRQELDIEVECGNSVVTFFALGESERDELVVYYTIRSKQLLGYAAQNIEFCYYIPGASEEEYRSAGGGYFSNAYVRYGNKHLELPEGTDRIMVELSWWGEKEVREIPVAWEVGK